MNRRSFIGTLLGALAIDPERLLWVPGKKTIFIPRPAATEWSVWVEARNGGLRLLSRKLYKISAPVNFKLVNVLIGGVHYPAGFPVPASVVSP